jgi:hypothetical protein
VSIDKTFMNGEEWMKDIVVGLSNLMGKERDNAIAETFYQCETWTT